jgi:hypothetical protein
MPALLKRDAIRCLQGSTDSLSIAIAGLAFPLVGKYGLAASTAPSVGLLGASAELAIAGCLVQTSGTRALQRPDGMYLSAPEALDRFRATVRAASAATNFLVQGVPSPDQHRSALVEATRSFPALFIARAAALHAGRGLTRDASITVARDIGAFHELLAHSQRLSPYLSQSPVYPDAPQHRVVLLDQLMQAVQDTKDLEERAGLVRSAFLVLPDAPAEQPEWLTTLSRVAVVPTDRDVSLLIAALERALPVELKKASPAKGANTLSVVVRADDPNALPIAPQYLRTEFTQIRDQWRADIAQANGRIKAKVLDLPPSASVREVFALGLEKTNVLEPGATLGPHEAWPSIAASLNDQGTAGPYWFIVRRATDLDQLGSLIRKAAEFSKQIRARLPEFLRGLDAIDRRSPVEANDAIFRELQADIQGAEANRVGLAERVQKTIGTPRALVDDLAASTTQVSEGELELGALLTRVLEAKLPVPSERYWINRLTESAYEAEDSPGLLAVLSTPRVVGAHTAARKALRLIDFRLHGPPVAVA